MVQSAGFLLLFLIGCVHHVRMAGGSLSQISLHLQCLRMLGFQLELLLSPRGFPIIIKPNEKTGSKFSLATAFLQ